MPTRHQTRFAVAIAVLCGVNTVRAQNVTYTARIEINFLNNFLGVVVATDDDAIVTISYAGADFEIVDIVFDNPTMNPAIPVTVTLGVDPNTTSAGTIAAGTATGQIDWSGTATAAPNTYTLQNSGGSYAGAVSGSTFQPGDVYELQVMHLGTLTPPINGQGNWDHLSALDEPPNDPNVGTRITFLSAIAAVPGDFDGDGDVDTFDEIDFQDCRSGPTVPVAAGCEYADLDGDDDADHDDFGILQRCISGVGVPADPICAN